MTSSKSDELFRETSSTTTFWLSHSATAAGERGVVNRGFLGDLKDGVWGDDGVSLVGDDLLAGDDWAGDDMADDGLAGDDLADDTLAGDTTF